MRLLICAFLTYLYLKRKFILFFQRRREIASQTVRCARYLINHGSQRLINAPDAKLAAIRTDDPIARYAEIPVVSQPFDAIWTMHAH